jgi:hypothetical protein
MTTLIQKGRHRKTYFQIFIQRIALKALDEQSGAKLEFIVCIQKERLAERLQNG